MSTTIYKLANLNKQRPELGYSHVNDHLLIGSPRQVSFAKFSNKTFHPQPKDKVAQLLPEIPGALTPQNAESIFDTNIPGSQKKRDHSSKKRSKVVVQNYISQEINITLEEKLPKTKVKSKEQNPLKAQRSAYKIKQNKELIQSYLT